MGKILCCIPARYPSSRLPGKPLLKINDKTIINLVYEKAQQTNVDKIIVLTDDKRIYDEVESFGGSCAIITEECSNGAERIVKYLQSIDHHSYDVIVNIQGDEPFINPEAVNAAIENYRKKADNCVCSTICYTTKCKEEIASKSCGKVILDNSSNILYCSRNVIPTNKKEDIILDHAYHIHVGLFVYDKHYLLEHYTKSDTTYQILEDIEWLKIIEQGFKINSIIYDKLERGLDTIDDYEYLVSKYTNNL